MQSRKGLSLGDFASLRFGVELPLRGVVDWEVGGPAYRVA